jgi:hypothetical protein
MNGKQSNVRVATEQRLYSVALEDARTLQTTKSQQIAQNPQMPQNE